MTLRKLALWSCSIAASVCLAPAAEFDWRIPAGFPRPAVPASNPMTAAKVELGRHLFYDQRLSVNGQLSCGGCHRQELAFTDGLARGKGATGEIHPRASMSLINIAYAPRLTWANPKPLSLEEQAWVPMLGAHPVELGLKGHEMKLLATLLKDPLYERMFAAAFPDVGPVSIGLNHVTMAIAAFERSIVSMRSPYDRYRWGGDATAISDSAKRGEIVFSSSEKAGCFQCHGGWNFSAVTFAGVRPEDDSPDRSGFFFNTGGTDYAAPNTGLAEHTGRSGDIGKFKAPTLRNIAVTAPYMHDGSIATLESVIEHYASGGRLHHANKSPILRRFRLSDQDKLDLIAFLMALTDEAALHDARWSNPWPKPSGASTR